MSPESLIIIAMNIAIFGGILFSLVVSYIRGVQLGTKRYRDIVDNLRKWRVLEPDEAADSEHVRELVLNWARLSRGVDLVKAVAILILVMIALSFYFKPELLFPRAPFTVWLLFTPVIVLTYVCLALATIRTLSRAQMSSPAVEALPPFALHIHDIRAILRLALLSVMAFGTLALGTLVGLLPYRDGSSDWTAVRAHPILLIVLPVAILAMIVLCVSFDRRLTHLRPVRLSRDHMLSLRASVAFTQEEVNRSHSGLAYLVGWASMGQLLMLPYYGDFSILLFVGAFLVLLVAYVQSVKTSSPMILPPPELFLPTSEPSGQTEGQF